MTTRPPQLKPKVKPLQSRARRVHLVMRDGTTVDGGIYMTDAQALAPYLGSRPSGWVNVVDAVWLNEGERHNHAVIQADHILMAIAQNDDAAVQITADGASPRPVDIKLEDDARVRGSLVLQERQRMSDFLTACGKFLPLVGATRVPGGAPLGDIALNAGCVRAVRDAKLFAPGTMTSGPDGTIEWADAQRAASEDSADATVNREIVRSLAGAFAVVTPARTPNRRTGERSRMPVPESASVPRDPSLSFGDAARAAKLSRHWLVLIAAAAQLRPPDPRTIPDPATVGAIWGSIAARNEMAEAELALHVASAYHLDIANLDEVTAEAVALVPEATARRLGVIPLRISGDEILIAVSDPDSLTIEEELASVTKLSVRLAVATPNDIFGAIEWHYGAAAGAE